MIVTCDKCKENVQVNMYFYDENIRKESDPFYFAEYWEARCRCKAICPCCGYEIQKYYVGPIEPNDIIKLATGGKEE